jgi:hypothetical protein
MSDTKFHTYTEPQAKLHVQRWILIFTFFRQQTRGQKILGWMVASIAGVQSRLNFLLSRRSQISELRHIFKTFVTYHHIKSLPLIWWRDSNINLQGNSPIRLVETCPDFLFHCKNAHNKINCQNSSC